MAQEKLTALLSTFEAFITYVPLRTEVDWRMYAPLPEGSLMYEIAPRAALDPLKEAASAKAAVDGKRTAILIPGRKFDAAGTRHGQGGGWYDRFLAEVPREWLRLGFCFDAQFSSVPLLRQSWDQAMDGVCVVSSEDGNVRLFGIL